MNVPDAGAYRAGLFLCVVKFDLDIPTLSVDIIPLQAHCYCILDI